MSSCGLGRLGRLELRLDLLADANPHCPVSRLLRPAAVEHGLQVDGLWGAGHVDGGDGRGGGALRFLMHHAT